MILLQKTYIYRMLHWQNVEHVLTHGLCNRSHQNADPDYINIGHERLIEDRHEHIVNIQNGGHLGEYIPFYFAGHSPMLLMIKNGTPPVAKKPQEDIVFVVSNIQKVKDAGLSYCFTDRNAKLTLVNVYTEDQDLSMLDWTSIQAKTWNNVPDNLDRQDRKQAEFLVRDYMPVNCIQSLVVKTEERKVYFEEIVDKLQLEIGVYLDNKCKLYY